MLPASVLWMPAWHAHEMLFGFALAVVAGNQLGPASGARISLLFAAWMLARFAFLVSPTGFTAAAVNTAFAGLLALQVAPRLLRSAKKLRNQALPVVLIALCIAAAAFHIRAAVLLFAALMLFMGGRIIAPIVAGQLQRQGVRLGPRAQPRLEGALLVLMGLAVLASLSPRATPLMSALCGTAGLLAAIRMLRWRLWAVRRRPDLLCLAAGYAWLAAGLVAFGVRPETALMHLITVGALGTLTFNVMAMSWLLRARLEPAHYPMIVWGTLLLAAAVLFRVVEAYEAAALCWSAAYLLLLALFRLSAARR